MGADRYRQGLRSRPCRIGWALLALLLTPSPALASAPGSGETPPAGVVKQSQSPVFETIEPASGTVTSSARVTLLGRVSGPDEVTVSINEEPVTLWGQDFAVTRDLEAGENLFTLVA
ncbi:MAG: hypothetical protein GY835_02710, partial [bacterium]|nr:hypothetical protein [bacterium]